jgi:L-asparaginase
MHVTILNNMSEILFIQAGGTIDKDYLATDENHGYNFVIGESAFQSISKRVGIPYPIRFTSVCKKDSLDMDDTDRLAIAQAVADAAENKVIVLHGTDTIHVTAKALSHIKDKVIVLTGAMKPERFRDSDSDFNVGMAVGAVQTLPSGVYIALYANVQSLDSYISQT